MRRALRSSVLGVLAVGLVGVAPSARAAFPGSNGKIVFSRYEERYQLYLVSPDGSGLTQLTHGPSDTQPDWQPIP